MALSDPDILNNLFSLYRSLGTADASVDVIPFEHYSIVKARSSAWPNIAFGVDEEHFGPDIIASIAREAAALQLRPTVILRYNEAWVDLLKKQGFLPVDQWLGMSLGLAAFTAAPDDAEPAPDAANAPVEPAAAEPASDAANAPAEDEIRIVGEAGIHTWTQTAAEVLFPKQNLDVAIFEYLRDKDAELVEIQVAGQPAGTAMTYFDETGTPGIYMVGIKPECRGKGLGKKIMHFCFQRITLKGGDRCCLQSTRMGVNLYRSLGFQETEKYLIFCKIK